MIVQKAAEGSFPPVGWAFVVALAVLGALLPSCATPPRGPQRADMAAVSPPAMHDTAPRDYSGIHNAVAYHDGFISGSAPDGDAGFDTLAALGVKTIISVDGAAPDVRGASARGIRYIHLPIGYNGMDATRKLELVRATRDALRDGPVYMHCHHGKHRSAGAAATVAASLGWCSAEAAVARMRVSGTAPNYVGLYACAGGATPLSAGEIDAVDADFPAVSRPTGFVKAMVEIDEACENLKQIEASGWIAPADHPDLAPAAEAARLADLLRVTAEGERVRNSPLDFAAMLSDSGRAAQTLEDALVAGSADRAALSAQFRRVSASCTACHAKYRD